MSLASRIGMKHNHDTPAMHRLKLSRRRRQVGLSESGNRIMIGAIGGDKEHARHELLSR
jgi:hypothetical protein